jgi:hypothetical protein
MATSSSIDFTLTRDDIIQEALEQLGIVGEGETPAAATITSCSRTLNMMVKAWEAQGIHLWAQTTQTVTLVASQATYSLSPYALMLKQAWLRNTDNVDRPIKIDSLSNYNLIPNKTSTGKINRIAYDAGLTTGTVYVWPTPDDATDVLHIKYLRKIEDFDSSSDNADFPQEWLLALALNLAVLLAPKYGKTLSKIAPDLAQNASIALTEMQLWDVENAKVRIAPAANYGD